MYIPHAFQETDRPTLLQFIRDNSFALLVTTGHDGIPVATHLPIELLADTDGQFQLVGHLAKANPQWKLLGQDRPALAVFSGPHSYISSSWYDHVNVPTWNYLSVHITGRTSMLSDDETLDFLRQQVDRYEAHSRHPVSVESMTADYVRKQMRGVVAFKMTIDTMQGAAKLSQNRDDKNYQSIISELRQTGNADAEKMANEMATRRPTIDK
ncbi:FMN-binding negative transcriptional regulator [Spirosoma endbachense]|uniref:FMN-binding negative transcriptional regulator n=1 Tax=Spirosoma endbachense TaxID=2666025 RepID=A0A6P1W6M9_9BACT|nr:FMN-binding negative transcriptional regulator [Spirosoma endbachense]QHW00676.1 FMN-binding negative transcriptional regulator [Spirosoma endbachense]